MDRIELLAMKIEQTLTPDAIKGINTIDGLANAIKCMEFMTRYEGHMFKKKTDAMLKATLG